jgi:hypothetical protein
MWTVLEEIGGCRAECVPARGFGVAMVELCETIKGAILELQVRYNTRVEKDRLGVLVSSVTCKNSEMQRPTWKRMTCVIRFKSERARDRVEGIKEKTEDQSRCGRKKHV